MESGAVTPKYNARGNLRPGQSREFHCNDPRANLEEFPGLKDYLPENPDAAVHVCEYTELDSTPDHCNFNATFRVPLATEEDVKAWIKSQRVTWRVDSTYPRKAQRVLYKVRFRCQHMTRPRVAEPKWSKNTDCPAKMTVTLLRTQGTDGWKSRSLDPHVPAFPVIVSLSSEHNHDVFAAAAQKHRDVGEDAKKKLQTLFEAGHSPMSALDVLKHDLHLEHGDNYYYASADSALCPSLQYCYRLYHKMVSQKTAIDALSNMCGELMEMVGSDPSLVAPTMEAVKAFNEIKANPTEVASALRAFARQTNSGLASSREKANCRGTKRVGPTNGAQTKVSRRKIPLGERWQLGAGRPTQVTTGPDHVSGESSGVGVEVELTTAMCEANTNPN